MGRDRILVLFAPARIDHRLEETSPAQLRGVPGRPRQRTDDRGRQHDAGGCLVHGVVSLEALLRALAPHRDPVEAAGVRIEAHASYVQSVHLSCRIASTGCGTWRYDTVDFREIVCREHNVRGAHILLKVLARFRTGYRYDKGSRTRALGHWPSDGELGERGVLTVRDGLKRRAQPRS